MRPNVEIEGGDRACGELLLVVARRIRGSSTGSVLRLFATDPAAVLDVPAWCHLTGHEFLGSGDDPRRGPWYDLRIAAGARATGKSPWRLADPADPLPTHRRERPP